MKIIVDTSVWSLFLRRRNRMDSPLLPVLRRAIQDNRVQMLGIIRQELLSGIRNPSQFQKIEKVLDSFPDLLASSEDHTLAARFFDTCRRKGIQGSPVDFLICAQAHRNRMRILTADKDFEHYAAHLPVEILE